MVAADLQLVYQASTEAEAPQVLEQFQIKWDKKYRKPSVIRRDFQNNYREARFQDY